MQQPTAGPDGSKPPQESSSPKGRSGRGPLLIVGGVLLILVPLLALGVYLFSNSPKQSEAPVAALSTPTPVVAAETPSPTATQLPATPTAAATTTPIPTTPADATFGGLPDAFNVKFGQPSSGGVYTTSANGHAFQMTLGTTAGADGLMRVSTIVLRFTSSTFNERAIKQMIEPLQLQPPVANQIGSQSTTTSLTLAYSSDTIDEIFRGASGFHIRCTLDNAQTHQTTCTYAVDS